MFVAYLFDMAWKLKKGTKGTNARKPPFYPHGFTFVLKLETPYPSAFSDFCD